MKKVSIFAVALVGVFAMSSCKKDYTCNCTYTNFDGEVVTVPTEIPDSKKKDAEDACDAASATYALLGSGASCELD